MPAFAQISTMPEPMIPQPTTPTFCTSSGFIRPLQWSMGRARPALGRAAKG
jgi:hypothetical protein